MSKQKDTQNNKEYSSGSFATYRNSNNGCFISSSYSSTNTRVDNGESEYRAKNKITERIIHASKRK